MDGCRFCGRTDGALRPVEGEGERLRCSPAARRAYARRPPTMEHAACLEAAELERTERLAAAAARRRELLAEARAYRDAGDLAAYEATLDLLDEVG